MASYRCLQLLTLGQDNFREGGEVLCALSGIEIRRCATICCSQYSIGNKPMWPVDAAPSSTRSVVESEISIGTDPIFTK